MKLNSLTIDTNNSFTELCQLGIKYPTDKCVHNNGVNLHKHPYTPIYDMLFRPFKYLNITIGEIGILNNNSIKCWREYFETAFIYGFDSNDNLLSSAKSEYISKTSYHKIDVNDISSIKSSLSLDEYDILIDDSTHEFKHHVNLLLVAHIYIRKGGMLIIEDIFRNEDEKKYEETLSEYEKYYSSGLFIIPEHVKRSSPGWNNDKLLILYRNDYVD